MASRIRSMCLAAMFAVLMMIGAWITVPMTPPFTMQTFVLYGMIWLLTPTQMTAAVGLYILLGVLGVPVFSGFQGGIGVMAGPTGGYLLGFLLMAGLRLLPCCRRPMVVCAVGTPLMYLTACVWYAFVFTNGTSAGFGAAALMCVVPFIVPDILKAVAAWWVCRRIRPQISSIYL